MSDIITEATGSAIAAATTKGLLIEEARTNLLTQSDDIAHADWTVANATIAADDATAPDGSITADKITDDSTNATHSAYQTKTGLTANDIYTSSFYAKAGTKDFISIKYYGAIEGRWALQVYDLSDGTLGESDVGSNSGTIHGAGIKDAGNGWYRCWLAASVNNTTVLHIVQMAEAKTGNTISTFGSINYIGTSQTVYSCGAQFEAGAFPTSYIPTTTTAVTRDLEEVDGDATLYKDTMTITGEFNSGVDAATGAMVFNMSDGTTVNSIYFYKHQNGNLEFSLAVSGVKYLEKKAWTPGTTKFAIAISPNIGESAVYINGARLDATPTTDIGHAGLEGTIDEFKIGRYYNDTLALNGTIKNFKIYHELKDATWLAAESTP